MAVTVESVSTRAMSNSSATITLTKPSGTVDDDLLIVAIGWNAATETMSTVPSGWTELEASGGSESLNVYYKVASSEGASWDWVLSGAAYAAGIAIRISGNINLGSLPIVSTIDGFANDPTPVFSPGITPGAINSVLVFAAFTAGSGTAHSAHAIVTSNPSWTERFDSNASTFTFSAVTASRTEGTATGDYSLTIDGGLLGDDGSGALLAINEIVDASINATPLIISSTLPNVTVTGDANITATPLTLSATLTAATTTLKSIWTKLTRSSSSWTRQNKS